MAAQNQRPTSAQPKPVASNDSSKYRLVVHLSHLCFLNFLNNKEKKIVAIASSPAKPRNTYKYEPSNGARTVGPSSGMNIPRRSTTLYEKNALDTEKSNVSTDNTYVFCVLF